MSRVLFTSPFPSPPAGLPADVVVLTPHPQAADAIGAPHVSMRTLATERLAKEGLVPATPVRASILLKRAVRETVSARDAAAVARRFKQIVETVMRTGIDADALVRFGSARVRHLGLAAARYQALLRAEGLVDPQEVVMAASRLENAHLPVCVYGYFRARKEEISFIDAIAGDGSVYYLPCHEDPVFTSNRRLAGELVSRGWARDDAPNAEAPSPGWAASRFLNIPAIHDEGNVTARRCADVTEEVRAALARVKQLVISGTDASRIAIVCRDLGVYAKDLACVSREYGLPLTIKHDTPLDETRVGAFVRMLLEAAETGFAFEASARLLNHPYGPGLPEGAFAHARRRHTGSIGDWKELGADLDCLVWEEKVKISERINCLKGALDRFEVRAKAGFEARETLAYGKLIDALDEMAGGEDGQEVTVDAFGALVREILSAVSVPFDPCRAGVAAAEPHYLTGGRYQHLFVMGLAEGMYPGQIVDNPVVDFHERKSLVGNGIEFEDAAEVPRWEALSFYFLLLAAEGSVHVSYPRCVNGEERIPGPFFDRLGVQPAAVAADSAASPEEMLGFFLLRDGFDDLCGRARERYRVEFERESADACGEFDGAIGVRIDPAGIKWSVSQLTSLGQCGFKWFAQKVLRIKPIEEMESGLTALTRGSLYHKVLEIAVRRSVGAADLREAVLADIEAAFNEAELDADVKLPSLPNWHLERLEHLEVLRNAVRSADFIRDGAEVAAVEEYYEGEWMGFRLCGRIDRIDRTADGLWAIDYKAGSSAPIGVQNAAGKAGVDIQLPIYLTAALPVLHPAEEIAGGSYFSITKGKNVKKVKPGVSDEAAEFATRAKNMLETGSFAVGPDSEAKVCEYCDYDSVCRTGNRMLRKRGGA
jgi:RecB family exonuclease